MGSLQRSDDTGLTLYVILRNASHQPVIAATGVAEAYNAANWGTYDHAATEQGASGYYYVVTSDDLADGAYWIEWKYQAGASPAVSDTVRASGMAYWSGSAWVLTPAYLVDLSATASDLKDDISDRPTIAEFEDRTKPSADYADKTTLTTAAADALAAKTAGQSVVAKLPAGGASIPSISEIVDGIFDDSGVGHTGIIPTNLNDKVSETAKIGGAMTVLPGTSLVVGPTASTRTTVVSVSVLKNATKPLCARVINKLGVDVTISYIASIVYSIYAVDPINHDEWTVVAGHDAVSLTPSSVLFDSLQSDGLAGNYNFKHEPDVRTNQAFEHSGLPYTVEYRLTPSDGSQDIVVRFAITVL